MAKFNIAEISNTVRTHEGGTAYSKSMLVDWFDFMFSSYLENQHYETACEQTIRFINLTRKMIEEYGIEFVMRATIFARNEVGLRSISHLAAAIINDYPSENKRVFFKKMCSRPDDISEIFAAIDMIGGKRSHALIRGCCDYLRGVNEHVLAKYKMTDKKYNLFDIINLTHAHSDAITAYKNGNLSAPDTWEVKISGAKNEQERANEWKRLVEEGRLGYIALIRNIRNILKCDVDNEWIEKYLVPAIVDEESIIRSKIMPYQIYCSYAATKDMYNIEVYTALNKAFLLSIGNMPDLDGSNCIVLDVSGSMESPVSARSHVSILEMAAVYATCVYLSCQQDKGSECDIIKFGTQAGFETSVRPNMSALGIVNTLTDSQANWEYGGGTVVSTAMDLINKHYDRVFVFSDLQACNERQPFSYGTNGVKEMLARTGIENLYSFDLGSYKDVTLNSNDPRVHFITAIDENVLKFIRLIEEGNSIEDYIRNYSF